MPNMMPNNCLMNEGMNEWISLYSDNHGKIAVKFDVYLHSIYFTSLVEQCLFRWLALFVKNFVLGKCCQQPTLWRSYVFPDHPLPACPQKMFKLTNNMAFLVCLSVLSWQNSLLFLLSKLSWLLKEPERGRQKMACKAHKRNRSSQGGLRSLWQLMEICLDSKATTFIFRLDCSW